MGRQHGELLKNEILNDVMNRILYGIGVGSSFDRGKLVLRRDRVGARRASSRSSDRAYLAEMDALADAVGVHRQEARLANFFPELFHCSGFSIIGDATDGGRMYHGRVLDYMRGVGLEQNAGRDRLPARRRAQRVGQRQLRRVRRLGDGDEREGHQHRRDGRRAATATGTASRWPSSSAK